MEYLRTGGKFPSLSASAITLGKFDGLHRGHRELLSYLLTHRQESIPAVLFALGQSDRMIFTEEERRHLAASLGVDLLIECPLNDEIRLMEADEFVRKILVERLGVSLLTVGEDFRFGYGRKGDVDFLKHSGEQYGFSVKAIPSIMAGEEKISSTRIRELILEGRMEAVRDLLGGPFFLEGKVVHGKGLGHRLLLPTANLIPPIHKLMPPRGVYMTLSYFEGVAWPGITNVGFNPTVDGGFLGVETYLFDCEEDLYDRNCRVEFLHYSRPEKRFASLDQLKTQLLSDAKQGKRFFKKQ